MEMTLKPPRGYPLPPINPLYVFIAGVRINEAVSEEEALQLAHNANNAAASGRHGGTGPTQQEIIAQTAAMRQLAAKREGTKAWAVSGRWNRFGMSASNNTHISGGKKKKTREVCISSLS
jgi:hypothetical protein